MAGLIKYLKNPLTGNRIFPVTKTRAIYNNDGSRLDKYLEGLSGSPSSNILINSNFANPINQRGEAVKSTEGYWIDRWLLGTQGNTIGTVSNDCINISVSNPVRGSFFTQDIEFPEKYTGKNMAISMRYRATGNSNDTKKCHLFVQVKGEDTSATSLTRSIGNLIMDGEWHILSGSVVLPAETLTRVRVGVGISYNMSSDIFSSITENLITSDASIDIEWIKAELGEIATPYAPRLYAEELQLCLRYYRKHSLSPSTVVSLDTNSIVFYAPIHNLMRVTPSVLDLGNVTLKSNGNTVSASIAYEATASLFFTKTTITSAHGLTYASYPTLEGYVILDAEL